MTKTYETLSLAVQPVRVRTFLNHISGNRIHWHQEMEILYFTEGEGVISCDLQEYAVRPGDIIVVNGKERKGWHVVSAGDTLCIVPPGTVVIIR